MRTKLPRLSIAGILVLVGLVAVDLAGARIIRDSMSGPSLDYLALSILPMLNVAVLVGYSLARRPGPRRPFAVGFLAFGLTAMLAHVACDRLYPEAMQRLYFAPLRMFYEFCMVHHVPYAVGATPEGYAYFRYGPALTILYSVPQFAAAGFGGLAVSLAARFRPRRRAT